MKQMIFCGKPIMLEQAKVSADGKPLEGRCFVDEIEGSKKPRLVQILPKLCPLASNGT
jgi:hypothetical protein